MRHFVFAAVLLVLAFPLTAQEPVPAFELGVTGWTPPPVWGDPPLVQPGLGSWGLYADLAVTDRWIVSPSVSGIVWDDQGLRGGTLRADLRYLLEPRGRFTPYLFGSTFAFLRREAYGGRVESARELGLGAGIGARASLPFRATLSLEARYDRWLGEGGDRLGLGLRVGIPIGRR